MFRRWPFFQRLLSWTKPHAPAAARLARLRALRLEQPPRRRAGTRRLQPGSWMGRRPSRPARRWRPTSPPSPSGRASRSATAVAGRRPGASMTATAAVRRRDDRREYRAEALVVAVGVAEPYSPPGPAWNSPTTTRTCGRPRPMPAPGVHPRQAELRVRARERAPAVGVPDRAVSPSHATLSVETNSLVGVRARYVQPYEDFVLGGGVIGRRGHRPDRATEGGDGSLAVPSAGPTAASELVVEVDDVISATGFVTPAPGPAGLGVSTSGRARLPGLTSWWESTTVPGIFFAGTIGQGRRASRGTACRATPARSTAPATTRRLLARRSPRPQFGGDVQRAGDPSRRAASSSSSTRELAEAPELWHQRGYLARVLTVDPDAGLVDDGVQPLTPRPR